MLGVLGRRCRWLDPTEREEVLHDAYVVLLEKERSGRLDTSTMHPTQIRAYLTRTALHKALDERKRASRRLSEPLEFDGEERQLPAGEPALEDQVLSRGDAALLTAAVARLPERRRQVMTMRVFLDRDPGEIQRTLGITERVYRREIESGNRELVAALEG